VLVDGTCTGVLTQRYFGRAACTCSPLAPGADLAADGFDSGVAPYSAGGAGGDVGAVGGLSITASLKVGGNLAVSGGDLNGGSSVRVGGDLAVGGGLGWSSAALAVGGSARVGGSVRVSSLTVGGTFTHAAGAALGGTISAATWEVLPSVAVAEACPCSAPLDVAAIVAQHRATNDDAAIGLRADVLAFVTAPTAIALPCGRFYLDRIQGEGGVTIRATGRAALFVGDGLTLTGSLTVTVDPGAELDLFVDGNVRLPATLVLGDPARPRSLRLWLSTAATLAVPGGATFAANLYAPAADLAVSNPLDLYGALTVSHLVNYAALSIHHDRAVASAAARCDP
jgi:hypothetical protein